MYLAKKQLGLIAIIFIMISGSCLAAPEIHRWVDDEGVVHFSEQPPNDTKSEVVDTRVDTVSVVETSQETPAEEATAAAEKTSPAEQAREERAAAREAAAEKKAITEAACEQNKAIIAQLEPFPRVMTTNAEGETVRMNDDERLKKLGEAQDYVAANCPQ